MFRVPLGCKNANLKLVLSFRQHKRLMWCFHACMHAGRLLYTSTGELNYECGAVGHVRLSCPVSAVACPSRIETEVQVNSHRNQMVINTEHVENDSDSY